MGKPRLRLLAPMLAAVALTVGVAACGGDGGTDAGTAAPGAPAEKVTLTVALFSDFHYAPLYAEFKKTHPNVEIVERRAQFNDHHTNLITQLATGAGAADVVAVEGATSEPSPPRRASSATSRTTAWTSGRASTWTGSGGWASPTTAPR
ncbi:extracellular solute-binding protein [Planomonospora sp. ID67723]|uniref:extracellular solute-binding protein n=1 Tax=Planomonospora sp. ID67723 TaxID=2738134 RepID=UPI00210515A7|nr:extracellular solute-binding protein [Planomonospora sp. ID67723]